MRFLNLLGVGVFLSGTLALAQFSPGPLSRAHSAFEGPTNCARCHSIGAGNRRFKCLSCHVEIRTRLASRRGLHSALLKSDPSERECVRCHSEHNGEEFVPIRWDVSLDEFDHRQTGYPLEGAHSRQQCRACHKPAFMRPAERRGIQMKDLHRSYLGLSRECIACHADAHFGQLGPDCGRCHDLSRWKNIPRFDHSTAKFPLAGAHGKVECKKCHLTVEKPKPHVKFTGFAFALCNDCHKDPHRGAFTAPCQSCHNERVWKPAHNLVAFDHSKTKFPLSGKHDGLACEKCHRTSDFRQPVAHARCADCHQDRHKGQFLSRADRGECAACHTVDGWKPAVFTVADHARTRYPLEGRHAAVACARCHLPAGERTVYRVRFEQCADCHQDPHQGQLADSPTPRCEDCHTVKGFRPSTFTLTRHRGARYPLAGAHVAVPCMDCHREHNALPSPGRYRFTDTACGACHPDPHEERFRGRMLAARGGRPAGCEACHTNLTWRDLTPFDHTTTAFALTGAHRAVACRDCHRPPGAAASARKGQFHAAPERCSGCHEDVHEGQFLTRSKSADCSGCHMTLAWKPSTFDHNTQSRYQLTGAHVNVPCRLCHKTGRDAGGRVVVVYGATPRECAACHGNQITN
jgi:hypothetical protein